MRAFRLGPVLGALLLGAMPAQAAESVIEFMERYEQALDHGDPGLLAGVYAEWDEGKAEKIRRYFSTVVAEFDVEFRNLLVDHIRPDLARVHFRRHDRFTDLESGDRVKKSIDLSKTLRLRDGRWQVTREP